MEKLIKKQSQEEIKSAFETVKNFYLKLERGLDDEVRKIPIAECDEGTKYINQLIEAQRCDEFKEAQNMIYTSFGIMTRLMQKTRFFVRLIHGNRETPVITKNKIYAFTRLEYAHNNDYADLPDNENATWCELSGEELLEYVTPEEEEYDVAVFIDAGHNGIYFDFETARYLLMGDFDGYMPCEDIFHRTKLKKAS